MTRPALRGNFGDVLLAFSLPVLWGLLTFLSITLGAKASHLGEWPRTNISFSLYAARLALMLGFCTLIFKSSWKFSDARALVVAKTSVPLGRLRHFFVLMFSGVVASFILQKGWLVDFVTFGVLVSPVIEEAVCKSVLISKPRRPLRKLLPLNLIAAMGFALMHFFYLPDLGLSLGSGAALTKAFSHSLFSFFIGITVIATGKLQPAILLHMASNLFFAFRQLH